MMSSLFALSRDLTAAPDEDAICAALIANIQSTFGYRAVVFAPKGEDLAVRSASEVLVLGEDEEAVAKWAYDKDTPAGLGTDTLPGAHLRYLPIRGPEGPIGVVGVAPRAAKDTVTIEDARLLESLIALAAHALERARALGKAGGSPEEGPAAPDAAPR
jgi:two-component system sensor histidine kinase KdpD